MKKYKWVIILLNLVLLLAYYNYSVIEKEDIAKSGRLILLELAPVDPRSLMQGDYMALRYKITGNPDYKTLPPQGYCVVRIAADGAAERVRFQENPTPLDDGEYLIKYKTSGRWDVVIGAESFFFQEGHAEKYEEAKYGGIRIDKNGNGLLTGLYDKHQRKIE